MIIFALVQRREIQMIKNRFIELIVDAAANDYENVQTVMEQVNEWATVEGIELSASDIVDAITEALEKGYLSSFEYSKASNSYEPQECNIDNIDELYFLATKKGRQLLSG
jgi:hypothetical protein